MIKEEKDQLMEDEFALLTEAEQRGYERGMGEEREKIKKNIFLLRQWINEKPKDLLITNEQLEKFLLN